MSTEGHLSQQATSQYDWGGYNAYNILHGHALEIIYIYRLLNIIIRPIPLDI